MKAREQYEHMGMSEYGKICFNDRDDCPYYYSRRIDVDEWDEGCCCDDVNDCLEVMEEENPEKYIEFLHGRIEKMIFEKEKSTKYWLALCEKLRKEIKELKEKNNAG